MHEAHTVEDYAYEKKDAEKDGRQVDGWSVLDAAGSRVSGSVANGLLGSVNDHPESAAFAEDGVMMVAEDATATTTTAATTTATTTITKQI